jgi:response regulator of citrate/malate metabolism
VFETIFKQKRNEKDVLSETIRQMDANYAKMIYELEKVRNLNHKIDTLNSKMRAFEEVASTSGIEIKPQTMTVKTKDAIKLILQKHQELTSSELSRIIKLSRTRCNEYLKDMENEGILVSRVNCRKKLYSLRQ